MAYAFLPEVVRPQLTVDIAVFTVSGGRLQLLLIERGAAPFLGALALPGGFVHVGPGGVGGEPLDEAAARELHEETGLTHAQVPLLQVAAFGAPHRDPRGRVITVAYLALVQPELMPLVHAGTDAAGAVWMPVDTLHAAALAFDHAEIITAALARLRHDVTAGMLGFALAPPAFSVRDLRAVHEAVLGTALDPANFRRVFQSFVDDGRVVPLAERRPTGKRPAALFRARGVRADAV